MKTHEGHLLEEWLIGEDMSPEDLANRIGVKKQTVYYHIGREIIGDSFKRKLQIIRSNPFADKGSDLPTDSELTKKLITTLEELNDVRKQLEDARIEIDYLKKKKE